MILQNERLELGYSRGIVTREYTERLIQESHRHLFDKKLKYI